MTTVPVQPSRPQVLVSEPPFSVSESSPFLEASLSTGSVTLRCPDGTTFKVYKNILSLASSFFKDMFTLPQPTPESVEEEHELSEVTVTENGRTIDIILRLIYQVTNPVYPGQDALGNITNVKTFVKAVDDALAAALKYDMPIVVRELCSKLIEAADSTLPSGAPTNSTLALRAYVLACKHGLKKEAGAAAVSTLRAPFEGIFIPELREINAAHYFRLIRYRTKIRNSIDGKMNIDKMPEPIRQLVMCDNSQQKSKGAKNNISKWWQTFLDTYYGGYGSILGDAPLSEIPFSLESTNKFLERVDIDRCATVYSGNSGFGHMNIECSCRVNTIDKRQKMLQYLKETISAAVHQHKLDLSEFS